MNLLTVICLIAASAQMAAPPAAAPGQPGGYGWHRNEDGSLSYIVNIAPGEVETIAAGNELVLRIPEAVRPDVSQVIVRIGDTVPERDPPEAELIEKQRQRQMSGQSLSLATPVNRGNGGYKTIDNSPAGEDPLQQAQFAPPQNTAGQSSMQNLQSPASNAAQGSYAQANPPSRNPALTGRSPTDPPSMFQQPPQQQPAYQSNSSLTTQPPTGSNYPTTPTNQPARPSSDPFSANPAFGGTSQNGYGQTNANQQQLPSTSNPYPSYNPTAGDYGRGNPSLLTPGVGQTYTPQNQGYPNGSGSFGQQNQNLGGLGYSDPNGYRVAVNTQPGLGGSGTLPTERGYTSTEVQTAVDRALEQNRRELEQKFAQEKLAYGQDLGRQITQQADVARAEVIEKTRQEVEKEQAQKATIWQVMLIASVAINCYLFVLIRGLFTKYRSLQQNTRNSMSLAS